MYMGGNKGGRRSPHVRDVNAQIHGETCQSEEEGPFVGEVGLDFDGFAWHSARESWLNQENRSHHQSQLHETNNA